MTDMTTDSQRRLLAAQVAVLDQIDKENAPPPVPVIPAPVPPPANAYTPTQARAFLDKCGLAEVTDLHQATLRFQESYVLGPFKNAAGVVIGDVLAEDGDFGEKTTAAAKVSEANPDPKTGIYRVSPHFTLAEFKCKNPNHSPDCLRTRARRRLLIGMEKYREKRAAAGLGTGVGVLSGYRDIAWNAAKNGKPGSQHLLGLAFDPTIQNVPRDMFLSWNIPELCGVGYNSDDKKTISHLDGRPAPRVTFVD